jgi:hypothetical protein
MAKSREVKIAVVGDASQLQREMQKARASMGDFGAATERAQSALGSFLIGGAAILGAKKLVDAAAELEQAVGGTEAVFGSAAEAVGEFAKSAAQLSGLSENAARTLTSRLGAGLRSVGFTAKEAAQQSIFLTQVGADLAATLGGTTEEAVTALAATFRGEYDPIERYVGGLKASTVAAKAVAMGLAETENDVSSYAKAQATLALITENSAFAQGQFVRESKTAQGAAAIARAETQDTAATIGKSLLPIYTRLAETLGVVANAFGALPAPVQTGILAFTGIALVTKPLTEGIRALSDVMRALKPAFDNAVSSLFSYKTEVTSIGKTQETLAKQTPNLTSAFNGVTAALGAIGIAVTAAAVIWTIYNNEQQAAKKAAKDFGDTLDKNTGQITANTTALFRQTLQDKNRIDNLNKAGISVEEYTKAITSNENAVSTYVKTLAIEGIVGRDSERARQNAVDKIRAEGGARNELIATLVEQKALDSGLLSQIIDNTKANDENIKKIRDRAEEQARAAGASKEDASAAADAAIEAKRQADATAELNDQLRKKIDLLFEAATGQINLEQTGIAARKAIEDFNEAQRDGKKSADERRAAELNAQEAILRVGQAAVKAAEDQKGSALSAAESSAIQIFQLSNLANTLAPGSPLRVYIEQYIAKLNAIPPKKETIVSVETAVAIARIQELNDRITNFLSRIGIRIPSNFFPFGIGTRWTGGPVDENKPYLVGEKGPELFVPSSYGRIVDAFGTSKTMGAGMGGASISSPNNYSITVNVSPMTDSSAVGKSVVEAITAYERRNGSGWRS